MTPQPEPSAARAKPHDHANWMDWIAAVLRTEHRIAIRENSPRVEDYLQAQHALAALRLCVASNAPDVFTAGYEAARKQAVAKLMELKASWTGKSQLDIDKRDSYKHAAECILAMQPEVPQ